MDKKGPLCSGRPDSYLGRCMTGGDHMVVSSLDAANRAKRKILTRYFTVRDLPDLVREVSPS